MTHRRASEQLGFDFGDAAPAGAAAPAGSTAAPGDEGPALAEAPPGREGPAAGSELPLEPTAPLEPPGPSRLVRSLAAVSRAHPRGRKLIVARTRTQGRELLRQLALADGPWVGFEVTTLLPLAMELAAPTLARSGLRVLDEFDEQSLLDRAIDETLLSRRGPLSGLAEGVGFRSALRSAVTALRLAGLGPSQVRDARLEDTEKQEVLARVLEVYEGALDAGRRTDQAGVLRRAQAELRDATGPTVPGAGVVCLVPELGLRGLSGRLVRTLLSRGARVLEADPVRGLAAPDAMLWEGGSPVSRLSFLHAGPEDAPPGEGPALFAASGVGEELREVLRRVMSAGLRWDDVEIVTPDPAVYGSALHALASSLDVAVSYGVGLPVDRTRPGRVVAAYFRWIEGGFGADVIRTLLAAGDLRPPGSHAWISPARLARRLRLLRIGWGRGRYVRLIDAAIRATRRSTPGRHESEAGGDRRKRRTLAELEALRAILKPTLDATPNVPQGFDMEAFETSPAELARGLEQFLAFVPTPDAVDDTAIDRLRHQLGRARRTLDRAVGYGGAAATLRGHLQLRVPAPRAEGRAPWSSAGGHLYLTDLEHGGTTGRRATFVVGLDATRFPGAGLQDPLLLDGERWLLGKGDLPRATDRQREAAFRVAALLARLRGSVTLSYSAWDPAEARVVPPALQMLLAHRLATRDPEATFEDLRAHLGSGAGPIPRGPARLDGRDVWLGNLSRQGRLLAGESVVRDAFPHLDAGLRAREAAAAPAPNPFNGLLRARPRVFDPRVNTERPLSASRLESLGTCPRRYLFQSVLRVWVPDDPELDPETWLNPLQRGDLLHRVYDRTLREARDRAVKPEALEALAQEVLTAEAARKLDEVPSPSGVVHRKEMDALRADVSAFVATVSPRLDDWVATELRFGLEGDAPVPVEVDGGAIHLRGAVDRVDRTPDGLVVVDYKTGAVRNYEPGTGAFRGGRRLQNWLYTRAVQTHLGEPVTRMEYHFPTVRGEGHVQAYTPFEMLSGAALVGAMLDDVSEGRFFPTDEPDDCTFCDFRTLCGVRELRNGVRSPMAEWSKEARTLEPALERLRKIRTWEG